MRTRWRRRRPKCKHLFHCHSSVLVTDFSFSEAAANDVAEPKEEVVVDEAAAVEAPAVEEAPAVAGEATETAAPDAPAEVEEKEVPVAAEPETSTVYVNDVSCI